MRDMSIGLRSLSRLRVAEVGADVAGGHDLVVEVPAATIGHTMASSWTMKSTTTGRSLIAMAFCDDRVQVVRVSQRSPTQPMRLGELDEVGDAGAGLGVPSASAGVQHGVGEPPVVEEGLPLADHPRAPLLMMATLIGMLLRAQVASSWLVIWKQPSPSIAQTVRSGPARLGAHRGRDGVAHRPGAAGVEPGARASRTG